MAIARAAIELIDQPIVTPLGTILARWSRSGLFACEFVKEEERIIVPEMRLASEQKKLGKQLDRAVKNYFDSGKFVWDLQTLDWTGVTDFQRAALEHCFTISTGTTESYGTVATQLGNPNAARAVGGAMARNRWPLLIPCHRVMGASGKLTGYSGAGGVASKQWLLDFESASIRGD